MCGYFVWRQRRPCCKYWLYLFVVHAVSVLCSYYYVCVIAGDPAEVSKAAEHIVQDQCDWGLSVETTASSGCSQPLAASHSSYREP
jgi:hypothetical protein